MLLNYHSLVVVSSELRGSRSFLISFKLDQSGGHMQVFWHYDTFKFYVLERQRILLLLRFHICSLEK